MVFSLRYSKSLEETVDELSRYLLIKLVYISIKTVHTYKQKRNKEESVFDVDYTITEVEFKRDDKPASKTIVAERSSE
jgi:hypothetical protein